LRKGEGEEKKKRYLKSIPSLSHSRWEGDKKVHRKGEAAKLIVHVSLHLQRGRRKKALTTTKRVGGPAAAERAVARSRGRKKDVSYVTVCQREFEKQPLKEGG